jgi:ammonium transporter, Amt family
LLNGNPSQLLTQFIAVAASVAFAFAGSLILLKIVDAVVGLRVAEEDEQMGLDLSQHSEVGYALED